MKSRLLFLSAAALCACLVLTSCGGARRVTEDDKIEHLLSCVASMKGGAFVQDGHEMTPDKAAEYLRKEWQSKRADIKTAGDFIRVAASFSPATGSSYLIRLPDGGEVLCGDHLRAELQRYEREIWRKS